MHGFGLMDRLSGLDAGFIAMESKSAPMHTLKFAVIARKDGRPISAESYLDDMAARIRRVPCYGQTLVSVPWGLHHPVLVDDPEFDPLQHVRVKKVAAPGGRRERDQAIAEVCGSPLDRSRPLWELWMLDGLAHGEIGCLLKLHHALADGQVVANQMMVFAGDEPAPAPKPLGQPHTRQSLTSAALATRRRDLARLPALIRRTVATVRQTRAIRASSEWPVPGLLSGGPRTRTRRRLSKTRSWGTMSIPLDEVAAAAKRHGVSVNDILLASVGGAVRHYLQRRGELPRSSLTAALPVNTSGPEDAGALRGNRFAFLVTTLATDTQDPTERLRRIHGTTTTAKEIQRARGDLLEHWWEYVNVPLLAKAARLGSFLGATRLAPLPTLGVSNVRGPAENVELGSGREFASEFYSTGPPIDGIGLAVTAWSYAGSFNVSLFSAANIVADPEEFLDALWHELRVLGDPAESARSAARAAQ